MRKLNKDEMEFIVSSIRNETKYYIKSNNLKSVVIGVSGGIDSAFVCALLKPVCDELNIPIIGRSITIETNKDDERQRASNIGKYFCSDFKEVNLTDQFNVLKSIDEVEGSSDIDHHFRIRMGNIKARMRMIYLYNLASKNSGLVMGTENATEHFLGFCTLHGDSGTDFEPIIGLWKTEVYDISEYLCSILTKEESDALMACIICNATDGLGVSTTDLDQILPDWKERHTSTRGGYEEVDDIFVEYFSDYYIDKNSPVLIRYQSTHYKRNNPYKIERENYL